MTTHLAKLLALLLTIPLTGCLPMQEEEEEEEEEGDSTGQEITIDASVRILDPLAGGGLEGVLVSTASGESATTDAEGRAMLEVPGNSILQLSLTKDEALDHLLFGPTGTDNFEFVTFMSTEVLFSAVQSVLGVSAQAGTGFLVVGIDYEDLSPVVGASASIDLEHDEPWVLGPSGASFSDTIITGMMGMVAFPNVVPGEADITVSPPEGVVCTAFPGPESMPPTPVHEDIVTVVTFRCH